MRAVELFAGNCGLTIGTTLADFRHALVLEWNHDACETIRSNRKRDTKVVQGGLFLKRISNRSAIRSSRKAWIW